VLGTRRDEAVIAVGLRFRGGNVTMKTPREHMGSYRDRLICGAVFLVWSMHHDWSSPKTTFVRSTARDGCPRSFRRPAVAAFSGNPYIDGYEKRLRKWFRFAHSPFKAAPQAMEEFQDASGAILPINPTLRNVRWALRLVPDGCQRLCSVAFRRSCARSAGCRLTCPASSV